LLRKRLAVSFLGDAKNRALVGIAQHHSHDLGRNLPRLVGRHSFGFTQVLSVPGPGAEIVSGPDGIAIARDYNDRVTRLISAEPDRFAAFAHLPMRSPAAAADELERAVVECGLKGALISGTVDDRFLDAPEFEPVPDNDGSGRAGV
jgi:hypothetical protein